VLCENQRTVALAITHVETGDYMVLQPKQIVGVSVLAWGLITWQWIQRRAWIRVNNRIELGMDGRR
jgi:hypothetical protein